MQQLAGNLLKPLGSTACLICQIAMSPFSTVCVTLVT